MRRHELFPTKAVQPCLRQTRSDYDRSVDNQHAQRAEREERIAATTSGIRSPVAVRLHEAGIGSVASSVRRAKSSSSIRCCVPMRVALSLPERIQRRTVSGSRLVRRAASGTVSIVATYYNNSNRRKGATDCEIGRCPSGTIRHFGSRRDPAQSLGNDRDEEPGRPASSFARRG